MNFTKEEIIKELKNPSDSKISLLIQPLSFLTENNIVTKEDIKYLKNINTIKNYVQDRIFEIEINITDYALFSAYLNTGEGNVFIDVLKYIDIMKEIKDNGKIKHKKGYFYININNKHIKIKEDKFFSMMDHLYQKKLYIDSYSLQKYFNVKNIVMDGIMYKRSLIENHIENRMFIQKAELFQNTGNIEDIPLNFIAYKIFREGKQCNPYKNNYFEVNEEYKKNAQKFIKRLSTTNIMKIYYELEKILLISPISVIESMVEEVIKFSSSIETMATVINQFHSAIRDIFYFYILNYIIETEINNYKEFNDKIFNVSKLLGLLDVNYKIIKKILRKLLKRKKFYYYNLLEIIIKKEEDMIFYKKIYKTIKNIEIEIFLNMKIVL